MNETQVKKKLPELTGESHTEFAKIGENKTYSMLLM